MTGVRRTGPVAYTSRTLMPTEKHYSQIKREVTAILWGCRHFYIYLYGHPFTIITDHKLLVPLLRGYHQSPLPPR